MRSRQQETEMPPQQQKSSENAIFTKITFNRRSWQIFKKDHTCATKIVLFFDSWVQPFLIGWDPYLKCHWFSCEKWWKQKQKYRTKHGGLFCGFPVLHMTIHVLAGFSLEIWVKLKWFNRMGIPLPFFVGQEWYNDHMIIDSHMICSNIPLMKTIKNKPQWCEISMLRSYHYHVKAVHCGSNSPTGQCFEQPFWVFGNLKVVHQMENLAK